MKKIFARFTVETQPIALFYHKTMKLFCFYFGKSSYLCNRKNNKIRFKMNTEKMKQEVAQIDAQIELLKPIIEEVRKQEQAIVAHRVALGVKLSELKSRADSLRDYIKECESE